MRRSTLFAAFASVALLAAPVMVMAQPEAAPPTQSEPAGPPAPPTPATPATSATPAAPETPAAPPAPTMQQTPPAQRSEAEPQGCRTRKDAGEACACLSDTDRIGEATPHAGGYNVCVRPT